MKVLLTGASSGIGKEIALGFIKEGATVIVASRNEKRVSEMQKLFHDMKHDGCSLQIDISSKNNVEYLMK